MNNDKNDAPELPPPPVVAAAPVLPKIKISRRLSEGDWNVFRKFLFDTTKEHDEETAFQEGNQGIHDYVVMMMNFYEWGRQGIVPPPWQEAFETMRKRQHNNEFQEYMEMKRKVLENQERFEDLESIDLTKLLGGPMRNVLNNKNKKKKT